MLKWISKPESLRRLHGCLALFWLVMGPVSVLWGVLRTSVPYLVEISVLALALSEFGAWQAARAEVASESAEEIARAVVKLMKKEAS